MMKETNRNIRKRGNVLLESIYDATVKVIKEVGYANLTFQQIAKTAKTSRTVIYRRWSTKFDLIREIKEYKKSIVLDGELSDEIQKTESLREDLLQLLTLYQKVYMGVGPEIMSAFLFELSQNNDKIAEIKIIAKEKNIMIMKKLLEFAKERGDRIKKVSNETLVLPFDLIRIENVMWKSEIDESRLASLVDEILIPVFRE
ncbi:TetR family transcriptional regulator [Clostridium tyrobutyricum]|uniref:Transcriptional regulator, TetR family n=2 Tax=Clostridium tyrobutyricum TaxID=1519 RepID=W6N9A3_CLOTY|nr:TetR/AcrR family transcriptional regulator [Clostridium tyrobutyricum]AND83654.1 transcription regulator [Clostridium tyrobutyricum]ANP68424.1 TetR family transcriptional regulator [Clostridium tyrobutyricum]MBR9649066.1 TetR/AcrR family transcriptional regulator [Clostridium tyrobutyricum]MBV4433870.1 TetR/AcrR family transcriptional regulator [Clostridium tyrobutyricum]MBV4439848.1 TetR/AcrR family transcriptional regulator [Clostridium tyrobutyricum]